MKRMLTLLLVIAVMLGAVNPLAAGAESAAVYQEVDIEMPEGYEAMTAISALPGGGFIAAAKSADGQRALIRWGAIDAQPVVTPLNYEGNDIERLSVAQDGSILVALSMFMAMDEGMRQPMNQSSGGMERSDEVSPPVQGSGGAAAGGPSLDGDVQVQGGESGAAGGGDQPMMFSMGEGGMNTTLLWLDENGNEISRMELGDFVSVIQALDGQRAAVWTARDGLSIYDAAGEQMVQLIGSGMIGTITADEEAVIALVEGSLTRYDMQTGKKLESMAVEAGWGDLIQWGGGTVVYLINSSGLYACDLSTGAQTKVVNGMGMLFGDPNNGTSGMVWLGDGGFVVLINEGGGSNGGMAVRIGGGGIPMKLAGYIPRTDIDSASRTDFVITALRDSLRLQKAASDFQRLHPELNVILQTQMAADDTSPTDDHIRTLNTDLLAGKGGDVLVLDGLPADKYAAKGILEDLSALLADVEILPGVRDGATGADGKMYAIPAQFSFDLLWGSIENIEKIDSLTNLAELPLSDGQTPFQPRNYAEWLRFFYPANEPSFRNESGLPELDSAEFAEFLEALYTLYSAQGELPDENLGATERIIAQEEFVAMLNGAVAFHPERVSSLMDLMMSYTIAGGDNADCTTTPTIDGASTGLIPSLRLGINSQSSNKQLAEEFIRLVLSDEVQSMEQNEGLPTLTSALNRQFEEALERATSENIMAMVSFDGSNAIELKQPNERVINKIRALIDTMDQQIVADETMLGFIVEECEDFFKGNQDAASVASAISQRAWSYLNE